MRSLTPPPIVPAVARSTLIDSVPMLKPLAKASVPTGPVVPAGVSVPLLCVTAPKTVPLPVNVRLVTEYPPAAVASKAPPARPSVPLLLMDPPRPGRSFRR